MGRLSITSLISRENRTSKREEESSREISKTIAIEWAAPQPEGAYFFDKVKDCPSDEERKDDEVSESESNSSQNAVLRLEQHDILSYQDNEVSPKGTIKKKSEIRTDRNRQKRDLPIPTFLEINEANKISADTQPLKDPVLSPVDVKFFDNLPKPEARSRSHKKVEVEGLDLDNLDMYMLSVKRLGDGIGTAIGCSVVGSVQSSRSGRSSKSSRSANSASTISSSRARRPGTARARRERAANPENTKAGGWYDSMQMTADLNNAIWYPELGWVLSKSNIVQNIFDSENFKLKEEESLGGAWEEPMPFDVEDRITAGWGGRIDAEDPIAWVPAT